MDLSADSLSRYGAARIFRSDGARGVNSASFHARADAFATANDRGHLLLYKASTGEVVKTVHAKSCGSGLLRFTHHETCVVFASTAKGEHSVRYLSFHDNKFLRVFKGHTAAITALAVSPTEDRFLSSALDGQVRLWDLREAACRGRLSLPTRDRAAVAFDQSTNNQH